MHRVTSVLFAIVVLGMALARLSAESAETAFEVATVKPTPADARVPIGWFSYPGGRLVITNCTLRQIVSLAYGVDDVGLSGGLAWIDADRWDINARAAAESEAARFVPKSFKSPPPPEMLVLLRALLEDRFALKLHRERMERAGFALTVGAREAKLAMPKDREAFSVIGMGTSDSPDRPYWLHGENASMDKLAKWLTGALRVPVVNQTGLSGEFDFKAEYADADALPAAIQEQLGLRLSSVKVPVERIVIDGAEKPSAN